MDNINQLAKEYRATRSSEIFAALYSALKKGWWGAGLRADIRRYRDEHEVQAMYDDAVLVAVERFREDFGKYLATCIRNAKYHKTEGLLSRLERRNKHEVYGQITECEEGEADETAIEIPDRRYDPQEVLDEKEKARTQRQLISELVAHTDDFTQTVVKIFPRYRSINALAKALGEHHFKVSRSIRRMSREYDANRYGSIYDLLA